MEVLVKQLSLARNFCMETALTRFQVSPRLQSPVRVFYPAQDLTLWARHPASILRQQMQTPFGGVGQVHLPFRHSKLPVHSGRISSAMVRLDKCWHGKALHPSGLLHPRSEERRVGKECRSRW